MFLHTKPHTFKSPVGLVAEDETGSPYRKLPRLLEPGRLPGCPPAHSGENLVEVSHPNITNVNIYHSTSFGSTTGWSDTVSDVFVREAVAAKLERVAESLPDSFGVGLLDGWRTLRLQRRLYEHSLIQQRAAASTSDSVSFLTFEEPFNDPDRAPSHTTGGAVDVTLTYDYELLSLGGEPCLPGQFSATCAFEETPGIIRDLRRMLYWSFAKEGFVVSKNQWWHFEYGTRKWSALTGNQATYGFTS